MLSSNNIFNRKKDSKMKKALSILLCLCMVLALFPTMTMAVSYQDYNITEHNLTNAQNALSGVADVTQDGENIVIKLTSDINGRLHIGVSSISASSFAGTFVLDLNGKTINAGGNGNQPEAICLDNNFEGTFIITGSGTMKTGENNIIYTWDANIVFDVKDGYDYFTLKNDGEDYFSSLDEKITSAQTRTWSIRGEELVMAQGKNSNGEIFSYAYDAQRSPDFPEGTGDVIELDGFCNPLQRNEFSYASSEGTWTLSEAGTYSQKATFDSVNTSYLDGIVNSVATKYGLETDGKNGIVIHKLTDESDALVAYGVVIAVDETSGYTLFIGDVWSSSGAAYLLSETTISANTIYMNAEQIAQTSYSVEVDRETISFTNAEEGYSVPSPETITVTNTGTAACGALNIVLSGGDSSAFTLNKNTISDIATNGSDTFAVVPKTGLAAGTYTETITISGNNIMPVTATVSFTVAAAPIVYTVTFDANGGTVAPLNAATNANGKLTSLPTPAIAGRYAFNGWYTAAIGGTQVTLDTVYTENTTIFAQWTYIAGGSGTSYYIVKFNTDGGNKIDNQRIRKNRTVTEPTTPAKDGFKFDGWYTDRACKKAYDFSAKVTEAFTLYAKWVEDESTPSHICPSDKFSDLDATKWYHEDIDYVLENGIMNGTSDNAFAPDESLTRAMLVTILYRNEGEPATNRSIPFADIDMGAYYASAAIWAQQNGIVTGVTETEFAPDNNITREQLATILFRYAQFKGLEAVTMEENLHFDDSADISEYAVSAMNWAVGNGYIFSRNEGKINPKEPATRAEIAAFVHRFIENSAK